MWKVCAEPTTSVGIGLWNSNSHEERPTSPVTPNPAAAAAYSLFLILLFHSVRHLRMLSSKHRRRRQRVAGEVAGAVGGRLNQGQQSKSLDLDWIKRSRPHRFRPKPQRSF